jgi:hypothetical protein
LVAAFGGAGTALHALVDSWKQTDGAEAINIGQLNDIGDAFYSRLVQIGYTDAIPFWLLHNPGTDHLPRGK